MYISTVITEADSKFNELGIDLVERLRGRVKRAAAYLADNPGVSRASILSDLNNGNEDDNSSQSIISIYGQLKEIFGDKKDKRDLTVMALQILAPLQEMFLRARAIEEQTGLDYYNDHERDELIDLIINNVLGVK